MATPPTGIRFLNPKNLLSIVRVKKSNFQHAIKSKENFHEYIKTPGSKLDPEGTWSWVNEDLLPTPIEKRTWLWYNYFNFYFSLSMDNWTLGSTMIGIGLSWWQAIIAIFVAQLISSIAMCINSRVGETYHIGYPIVCRAVFGVYGAYYYVAARAVLAVVYYSIKLYVGSQFVVVMLTAVFGHHFTDIHNAVPVSVGFTTQQFLAFFLYWLCHIPFTLLRPNQVKWLFTVKMFTVVPACIGLFIFCMVNTKAQLGNALPKSATLGGAGWFWIYAINSGIGNFANIITNQPDFARWAKYRGASIWSQLFASPISVTFAATLGILATSAINNVWGLELWNQWDLLSAIMVRYPRADVKFAVFLCAFFWAVLVMATNIAANMIAFGSDSSMLCPRYINMTRGQFLGLVLAWAMCPWKILFSAATFTNFLGGYIIFMASAVGIMIADYFFISRGNIVLKYLYSGDKTNPHYYYTYGWNIQALIAYVVGVCLPLPGFIGSLGAHVSMTATNLGHLGWCLSFVVSIVVYIAICRVWPTQNQKAMNKLNLRFEELTAEEFIYTGDAVYGRSMDRDSLDRRDDLENAVQISVSGEKKS